jgi:hypothetical protein
MGINFFFGVSFVFFIAIFQVEKIKTPSIIPKFAHKLNERGKTKEKKRNDSQICT